ncbi:MAG: transposase [Candidatus Competibacteraceae bacterium]|nr:transposase [Candidatus Competibacteraceae bacterium]
MGCGHRTRAVAAQGAVDPLLAGTGTERMALVGPALAGPIVAPRCGFDSRARIQAFLGEGLGTTPSIGTIHQTIHEASAVVAPAEAERIEAVLASDLLHADDLTSGPEHGQPLWLWVFHALTVTLYYVAGRGREWVDNVRTAGSWLMSDGWIAYRTILAGCAAGRICSARPGWLRAVIGTPDALVSRS